MDANSDARLAEVMPALAQKVKELARRLALEDISIRVTQGLRSWAQQQALYDQGRTKPGPIVTNCPGGHSYHNLGMAVDVVPDFADRTPPAPDWNIHHPAWQRIVTIATDLGLQSGALWRTFKDWPHLQLVGRFPEGAPNDEARQLFQGGGCQAVWQAAFEKA